MRCVTTDIVVIGAGPAGLSAAHAAAQAGARVDLIDAGILPGGAYWMQDPAAQDPAAPVLADRRAVDARAAITAVREAGVTVHMGAEVWAVFPDFRVAAVAAGEPFEVQARSIVVATGAQDRVMPFPGWTLPGVMTAGAGQRLAKLGSASPGERVVVAGSGPFLLAVAHSLATIGRPPAMLVEAQRPTAAMLALVARHPGRWSETARLLAAGTAVRRRRFGWTVVEALGDQRVTGIRIAPVGTDGGVLAERAETIEGIDALLVGWGFRPVTEITALLRCRHRYEAALGGWHCDADLATGRTSVEGVYAAGEVTGVTGWVAACLSGRLAGFEAAAALGYAPEVAAATLARLRQQLATARHFALQLGRLFEPPAGLVDLIRNDTMVCRCEEVTRGEVGLAFAAGTRTVGGAKLWTRAGMGRCQSRVCGWGLSAIAARETGGSVEDAGLVEPRIPLRPVSLAVALEGLREGA